MEDGTSRAAKLRPESSSRIPLTFSARLQRQLDVTLLSRCVTDPFGLLWFAVLKSAALAQKMLPTHVRIAIVQREPARLHLHNDAVAGQESKTTG